MRFATLLVLLLCMPVVWGATVHGEVYDFSLQMVDNVIVEINSTPQQRDITKEGVYRFDVEPGTYTLRAQEILDGHLLSTSSEEVLVTEEGDYVVDIILFPEIDEPVTIVETDDIELEDADAPLEWWWVLLAAVVAVAVFYSIFKSSQKGARESTGDLTHEVIAYLKQQGGRSTQKDIRKHFPHSEAKMSLVLTELESKGIVKKIKKGRGNVIVLQ